MRRFNLFWTYFWVPEAMQLRSQDLAPGKGAEDLAPRSGEGRYARYWVKLAIERMRLILEEREKARPRSLFPALDYGVFFGGIFLFFWALTMEVQYLHHWGEKLATFSMGATLLYFLVRLAMRVERAYLASAPAPPAAAPPAKVEPVLKTLGRYQLLEEVGAGAFGRVYRAIDPDQPKTMWAVKEMLIDSGPKLASLRQSFDQEQKVLSWLDHPGIVRRKEFFAH